MSRRIGDSTPASSSSQRLAQAIDHTKLTFAQGEDEREAIRKLCGEARENGFYAVCVRPRHVGFAKGELSGTAVKVATVIGFPPVKVKLADEMASPTVGNFTTGLKVGEIREALRDGVDELDVVMNVARFKKESKGATQPETLREFREIRKATDSHGRIGPGKIPVKMIIETDLLTDEEIAKAARLCAEAGLDMVKTSTGMVDGGQGGTPRVVQIISDTLAPLGKPVSIKASGGIKNTEQAMALLEIPGVARLGTSSGVDIVKNRGGSQATSSY